MTSSLQTIGSISNASAVERFECRLCNSIKRRSHASTQSTVVDIYLRRDPPVAIVGREIINIHSADYSLRPKDLFVSAVLAGLTCPFLASFCSTHLDVRARLLCDAVPIPNRTLRSVINYASRGLEVLSTKPQPQLAAHTRKYRVCF